MGSEMCIRDSTAFESLQEQPSAMMYSIDIIPDLVPNENLFKNFKEAIRWIKDHVDDSVSNIEE